MDAARATVFLRPIGSPLPLGMSGLVGASLAVSGLELGWISSAERPQVALVLLGFAFPLQFTASLVAFAGRDGVVGSAMGLLAGTWLSTGLIWRATPPTSSSGTLGLLLLAAGFLLAVCAAGAASAKLAPAAVFAVEALRFALAGVYELSIAEGWQDAAGVVGLAVVVMAGYTMFALSLESAHGRTVAPLGRRAEGATAMSEPLAGQVDAVEHEAGVRKQL